MKKILVAVILIGAAVLYRGTRLPDAPQPIAWNYEACAHCRMLIGDPAFAAQVITPDGETLSFDDPGCAAAYLRTHDVHRAWFHTAAGWRAADAVGFLPVARSPMGSNVMAVPKGTAGALGLEAVR